MTAHDGSGTEDRCKDIVEVVSDAAGEIPDAVDLLCMQECILHALAFGNIACHEAGGDRMSGFVEDHGGVQEDVEASSARRHHLFLDVLQCLAFRKHLTQEAIDGGLSFRRAEGAERSADDLCGGSIPGAKHRGGCSQ